MEYLPILQALIALCILNVWLLRFNKTTAYRGGKAKTMLEEFKVYGLSTQTVYVVGFVKVVLSILLIVGIWFTFITTYAAGILALFMLAAIFMHLKVQDTLKKTLPAIILFILSAFVAYMSYMG